MTLLGRLLAFFPLAHGLAILAAANFALGGGFSLAHSFQGAMALLLTIYVFPVACYRLHALFYPLRAGVSYLDGPYSPWWGSHQIQLLFISFPFFERAIHLVPGAYSFWLRLWGAKVGRGVYWTPCVVILDRPLVEIGHHAVMGHEAVLLSHIITRSKGRVRLFMESVRVGDGAFIGGRAKLGPGVKVEAGVTLPYNTEGWMREVFREDPAPKRGGAS